ncbi:MAG: thioredoxin domain-containing protein [Patescibacteria group bacterium]
MEEGRNNSYAVPLAIIIAGAFIALAIYFTSGGVSEIANTDEPATVMRPVTASDHILGDPNAPVKIVEFADLECPYCKDFHRILIDIMDEYGKDGRVALVYRHFPLSSIHPKAVNEAHASECAAELGGNGAFWDFIERIFTITPSNNGLDLALLPDIAEQIGLNREEFESCQSSQKHLEAVSDDLKDAISSGGEGTPWSIILNESTGEKIPFNGLISYEDMKMLMESLLVN